MPVHSIVAVVYVVPEANQLLQQSILGQQNKIQTN